MGRELLFLCRLDIPVFYKEARRVLKPDGALVTFCYMCPMVKGNHAASQLLDEFFTETLKPYLQPAHRIFMDEYKGNEPTPADFRTVERDCLDFEQSSSIRKLVSVRITEMQGRLHYVVG